MRLTGSSVPSPEAKMIGTVNSPIAEQQDCRGPERQGPGWTVSCRARRFLLAGGVLVLSFAGLFTFLGLRPAPSVRDLAAANLDTDLVRRAAFRVTLTDRGEVDSRTNKAVINEVYYRTTIIKLVPEGTCVKAGDVVCELDSSEIREMAKEREILLSRCDASLKSAEESVEIQAITNDRWIAAADHDLAIADLELQGFEDAKHPQTQQVYESRSTLAEEALLRAGEANAFTDRMARKGYRTAQEVDKARYTLMESEIALAIAEGKQRIYEDFTAKRSLLRLQALAKASRLERTRIQQRAGHATTQAEITLLSQKWRTMYYRSYHKRLLKCIDACTLRAPCDGKVIYASTGRSYSRYRPTIEEGARVYYRQHLFRIPDLSELKIDVRVHEARIRRVVVGQPVTFHVESHDDVEFRGVVGSISEFPTISNHYFPDRKEYDVVIRVTDDPERVSLLKPGMTADVEILVEERPSVLQVPIESIVAVGEDHLSWVVTDRGLEPRRILIGDTNDTVVEITGGLSEGDEVVLQPPTELVEALESSVTTY